VTTKRSGRWIIPKGKPEKRLPSYVAAAREAFQEAGVVGRISRQSIGRFKMRSRFAGTSAGWQLIEVFPLAVRRQKEDWLERNERSRRWLSLSQAAYTVHPRDLGRLIDTFDSLLKKPRPLRKRDLK
jgi:8-oxo-dGTP pyrophosphatase MutT (NUDIX family)